MIWNILAKLLALPFVVQWLIARAMKTPYLHIVKNDSVYMERFWLFNAYRSSDGKPKYWWCPWSVRIHHIRRPDQDDHMHDHPWNARTFILLGGYIEERLIEAETHATYQISRWAGCTAKLGYGEFHRIISLFPTGAWTLFISGPYQGVWGYLVDGLKVQWRTYNEQRNPDYIADRKRYESNE